MAKVLSIYLAGETAKLSEVALSGKKVQVYNAYDINLSEGLCDEGAILDVEGLAAELKQHINRLSIKSKHVVFSIASKRIASKEVVIPYVKEKQIASIIKANAQEYFPIGNIEEYALNYSILELVQSEANKQYRLSVTATPNDILESYYSLASLMKLNIDTIDYAGNAILQILKMQTSSEVVAILQLGRANTVINIMNGNVLIMQRTISYGLDTLVSSVADAVHLDDDEAEAFIEDNDITKICGAYQDVADTAALIMNGIGRIFEFYTSRSQDHPITGVLFLGDGTKISGIGSAMERNFGYQVEEIQALHNVDIKNKLLTSNTPTNFLANIGAVVAPMNMKFITQKEAEKKEKDDKKLPWGLVVISFIGSVALIGASTAMYFMTKSERDALNSQLASLSEMQTIEDQLNEALTKSNAIEEFYNSTKGPSDSLSRLIKDMEMVMPTGMSIDTFSLSDGVVALSGGGLGKESIAKFIQQMRDLKYVQNVKVDLVSETMDIGGAYDSFTMSFTLLDVNAIEAAEAEEADVIDIETPTENVEAEASTEDELGGME